MTTNKVEITIKVDGIDVNVLTLQRKSDVALTLGMAALAIVSAAGVLKE